MFAADAKGGDAKRNALERSGWNGWQKCGNDHTRAAALHGVYYYVNGGTDGRTYEG